MRLLCNSICTQPTTWRRCESSDGQTPFMKASMPNSLAPTWRLIGRPRSEQASHSGSQWRSTRSGRPPACGSLHITIPLRPSPAARVASATARSMSQNGISACGRRRPPEPSCISAMASL